MVDASIGWQEKLAFLTYALEAIETKSHNLLKQLHTAERLHESQEAEDVMKERLLASQDREAMLEHEVARLEALLEAQKLQTAFSEQRMQCSLGVERATVDRLRCSRDDAFRDRDKMMSQLAAAYADMDTLQAVLADSVVYVRFLRRRVGELEADSTHAPRKAAAAASARCSAAAGGNAGEDHDTKGVFSLGAVKAAVAEAVQQAADCSPSERKRRIRGLQLRWHPDKNPVLKDFATEVSKLINEALRAVQQQEVQEEGADDSDCSDDTLERRDGGQHPGTAAGAAAYAPGF